MISPCTEPIYKAWERSPFLQKLCLDPNIKLKGKQANSTTERIKYSGNNPKVTRIASHRIQKNHHKDAQWSQEKDV